MIGRHSSNLHHRQNSYSKKDRVQFGIILYTVNLLKADKGLIFVVISYVLAYNVHNNESNVQIIKKWTVVSIIDEWLPQRVVGLDDTTSKIADILYN